MKYYERNFHTYETKELTEYTAKRTLAPHYPDHKITDIVNYLIQGQRLYTKNTVIWGEDK